MEIEFDLIPKYEKKNEETENKSDIHNCRICQN
jgi:hypothetical protein